MLSSAEDWTCGFQVAAVLLSPHVSESQDQSKLSNMSSNQGTNRKDLTHPHDLIQAWSPPKGLISKSYPNMASITWTGRRGLRRSRFSLQTQLPGLLFNGFVGSEGVACTRVV